MSEVIRTDGNKCTTVALCTCTCIWMAMAMSLRVSAWEFCLGGFAIPNTIAIDRVKLNLNRRAGCEHNISVKLRAIAT